MLTIRPAALEDLAAVRSFYHSLIDAMETAVYKPGWKKDVYPSQAFLLRSIEQGAAFIGVCGGRIASCMVLDHSYNESYRAITWRVEAKDSELLVIHALGVHPDFARQGLAGQMVRKAIEIARSQGVKAIRLDVLEGNLPAEKTYTKLGFQYRGTVEMFYEDTGWTDFRVFEYVL